LRRWSIEIAVDRSDRDRADLYELRGDVMRCGCAQSASVNQVGGRKERQDRFIVRVRGKKPLFRRYAWTRNAPSTYQPCHDGCTTRVLWTDVPKRIGNGGVVRYERWRSGSDRVRKSFRMPRRGGTGPRRGRGERLACVAEGLTHGKEMLE
jgi:hypothetical protein